MDSEASVPQLFETLDEKRDTTLPVAQRVSSAVDMGFIRSPPPARVIPRDWSVISGLVRIAEKVTSRTSLPRTQNPETADIIDDLELPDEEIAVNFQPDPIRKPRNYHNIFSLLLTIGLVGAVTFALISGSDPVSFAGAILVYVAYVAETVMFGPDTEHFESSEQYNPTDAATTLKRFIRAEGFIKMAMNSKLDIIEFQRCLDNSSVLPNDLSAQSIFEIFNSTRPLLVLKMKYKYDLFSQREEDFIERNIKDFIETNGVEYSEKVRKTVRTNVLIVDNHTRSLPRVSTMIITNPSALKGWFPAFWLNFWVHCIFTIIGLGWVHREVMDSCLIDKRTWTCSKVFVAEYTADVEFLINSFQGGSQFSNFQSESARERLDQPTQSGRHVDSAIYGEDEIVDEALENQL